MIVHNFYGVINLSFEWFRGRKYWKSRKIGIISGVADDVRQNIRKGMIKNDQFKNQSKRKWKDSKEGDNPMPRQREIPRINSVTIIYNGDKKSFDTFMEAMINDYLNSDSMPKYSDSDFIDKVEIIDKTAWSLDFKGGLW